MLQVRITLLYMKVLIISGPSGIGKSYIANYLSEEHNFQRIVPVTTRMPRIGEVNGISYHFLNEETYGQIQASGDLFMTNDFFGARYGFQHSEVQKIIAENRRPVTEIFTPTITQFIDAYPNSDRIFLMPPSIDFLRERMLRRGDSIEKVDQRLISATDELRYFLEQGHVHYSKIIPIIGDESILEVVREIKQIESVDLGEELKGQLK